MGRPKKRRLTHSEVQKLSRSEEFRKQEDSGARAAAVTFLDRLSSHRYGSARKGARW